MNFKLSFHCLRPILKKAVAAKATLSYKDVMHLYVYRGFDSIFFILSPNFEMNLYFH